MARKTTQRKRSSLPGQQSNEHSKQQKASQSQHQSSEKRWISAFDSNDHSLALVRSGVHGNMVRIVDVQTGAVRSEYTVAQGTKIGSISWGPAQGAQATVVLGLQDGSVHLYSPARGCVIKTFDGAHQGTAVVDVSYTNNQVFSLDGTGRVVQWDVAAGAATQTLRTGISGASRLLVSGDAKRVVVASHKLELWDLGSQRCVQTWPGHISAVHSLLWAADETMLVSAAQGDRNVHVWDASPQATNVAYAVLSLDCDAQYIDVSANGSILAIGADGALYAWHQVAVARRGKPTQAAVKDAFGYAPDGCLRMVSSNDADSTIHLQLARFSRVSGDEGKVLVVRGTTQRLLFENLALTDENGHFVGSLVVERMPVEHLVSGKPSAKDVAAYAKYSEVDAHITTPAAEAIRASQRVTDDAPLSPTLADRVRQLSVDPSSQAAPTAPAAAPTSAVSALVQVNSGKMNAGSLVRVLVQALHTADDKLLDQVLSNSSRTKIVRATVLGLPVVYVLPLIQQLFLRFHSTPSRASELLPWIQATLFMHSAYLTSLPNLVPQLSGFYQGIEARLESHQELLKLSGRLELAYSQIRAKSHFEKERNRQEKDAQRQNTMRPINVYKEEEDDLDDLGRETEPPTPVWQAEESTDDEGINADEADEKEDEEDQWSDESEDKSDEEASPDKQVGDDEASSSEDDEEGDEDEDEDGDVDLEQYD
ncbi:Small subunit (SSU) processome component [Coemansia erecta]|uniref:Small subunit (SSU) processome component n=1 Tax=Coemansia asiatica TaxID=1052880 RepID=A0A9W7XG49_9FUNG|nr:Small subunit (SSU) processome component [Coemansia asiatica]KAJ2857728.1 Small subunit (SSU) processome component [Coemansia erecta]KAJ2887902.1 Small subunit (SSU) processome component [Coemansia asiatica]